jgi:hypothetical protein
VNSAACAGVKAAADHLGLKTKCRTTANGIERGGKPFSRGHIYNLLSNPIYIGEIAHKSRLYPGQHPALIDAETWTAVRNQLAANASDHRRKADATEPSLLVGVLVDAQGERFTPSRAVKKGRRYRYYGSGTLITQAGTDRAQGWRLPAQEIEDAVIRVLADGWGSRATLIGGPERQHDRAYSTCGLQAPRCRNEAGAAGSGNTERQLAM